MNYIRTRRHGFSLLEILVVVAIISILASFYLATFAKVQRKAKQMVVAEGARQTALGRFADNANIARPQRIAAGPGREECRAAYRRLLTDTAEESLFTQLLYVVRNEAEFKAYWHTLINPSASGALDFGGDGSLAARDAAGTTFSLPRLDDAMDIASRHGVFPVAWEFLSTAMDEMTGDGLTLIVLYSDGHVDRMKYPHQYPATRAVAELSHRFVQETS